MRNAKELHVYICQVAEPPLSRQRRTLSVSSLRLSFLNTSGRVLKNPWVGQPAHGNPRRNAYSRWTRSKHPRGSARTLPIFLLFFDPSLLHAPFSRPNQRAILVDLIDFTASWKSTDALRATSMPAFLSHICDFLDTGRVTSSALSL